MFVISELFSFLGFIIFFFNDTATTEIYTLSLHDALPICVRARLSTSAWTPTRWSGRRSCSSRSPTPAGLKWTWSSTGAINDPRVHRAADHGAHGLWDTGARPAHASWGGLSELPRLGHRIGAGSNLVGGRDGLRLLLRRPRGRGRRRGGAAHRQERARIVPDLERCRQLLQRGTARLPAAAGVRRAQRRGVLHATGRTRRLLQQLPQHPADVGGAGEGSLAVGGPGGPPTGSGRSRGYQERRVPATTSK